MKGQKKDSPALELAMSILKTNYAPALALMQEQIAMIRAMPKGKERNFLQREYDDYVELTDNHISFKRGLLETMRLEDDPISYVFSKKKLAEIYEQLKTVPLNDSENDNMPGAR